MPICFENEFEKYGITSFEHYEAVLKDRDLKMSGSSDDDWNDIIVRHGLTCNADTLRKASQTLFGGYASSSYAALKGCTNKTQLAKTRAMIGEQYLLREQIKSEKNQLNSAKRSFVKSLSIAEELSELVISEGLTINVPSACIAPRVKESNTSLILHITDWHIGYVIDNCKGNYYNWDVANHRVDKLISETVRYIRMYDSKIVHIINTGDTIEQCYMRKNQSQFCEFNQSEQINNAIKIIFRLICSIAEYCNVEYDSVYGNHDRSNGDYTANMDGDNADTIIREQLKTYVNLAKMEQNVRIFDRSHTDKEIIKNIDGVMLKASHEATSKDMRAQARHDISMDEIFYDIILTGHTHNFAMVSENHGRYVVSTGCLFGYNDYSAKFNCATQASQTLIAIVDGKIDIIKDIRL